MVDADLTESTFRTKRGYCTLTDDSLVIGRAKPTSEGATPARPTSVRGLLALYVVFALGLLAMAARAIARHHIASGVLLAFLGVYFFFGVVRSRGRSGATTIALADIIGIEPHAPKPPFLRGYFVLRYRERDPKTNEPSRERRRLIIMPGTLGRGKQAYERATRLFSARGLLGTRDPETS